VIAVAVTVAAT